jgi:16S rRNA (uracil1498-N3)-methyltransferase
MRVPRLHLDRPLAAGTDVALDEPARHHVHAVLRLRPGAAVVVFDGLGTAFGGTLLATDRQGARVRLVERLSDDRESPIRVTLGLGVSRGERMDFAVQKAVELGAARIVPLLTGRTVVRLDGERAQRRHAHWRRIAVGACEQCGRNRVPEVLAAQTLAGWLETLGPADASHLRLLPDPRADRGLATLDDVAPDAVTVLVGPEGGIDEAERALAHRHGFRGVRLGPRILRTETAVVAVLAAVMTLWGDLGS